MKLKDIDLNKMLENKEIGYEITHGDNQLIIYMNLYPIIKNDKGETEQIPRISGVNSETELLNWEELEKALKENENSSER